MKLIKRILPLVLALALLLGCFVFADAAASKHTEDKYLRDTLTLAGSGFDSVRTLTVAAIEAAADDPALGYENEYSLMTSGGVFSKHVFSGVRLYELLVGEGLDVSLPDSAPVKFISKDGYIVTNEHVVADAKDGIIIKVYVQGYDEPFDAEVVGKDVQTDIAVIKIDGDEDFVTAELGDSDNLQSGELAVAIGNPLGTFQGSITVGVVSGIERPMNNNGYSMNLIQTDASVNGGNSGGPLINSFGEVIGVVNAKIATAEGMGFAIPINPIKSVIESLVVNGKVIDRPYLGITVKYIPKDSYFGSKEGVVVAEVEPGGPGEQAGFKNGDRIVSMDGVEIKVSNDIIGVRDSHACGDEIEVVVERDGKEVTLNMTIGDSADDEE